MKDMTDKSIGSGNKILLDAIIICALSATQVSALSDGYILCGAYAGKSTVLLDKEGAIVHTWRHTNLVDSLNGYSSYLLENGNLLRTSQVGGPRKMASAMPWQGAINETDPWGQQVWRYVLANDTFTLHHDMKPLRNGNILATSFVAKTKPQAIAAGLDAALFSGSMKVLLAEKIIEIKPSPDSGGAIVWEWNIFDHVVPKEEAAAHPERISGSITRTLFNGQWVHLNGIDYDSLTDLILFSSRVFSECYVIDHGTTTAEAMGRSGGRRGKGGDLLYRWGKPANYGASGATAIEVLHCPTWIPKNYPGCGHILFFHNNGMIGGGGGSEIIEIAPPTDESGNFQYTSGKAFGPAQPIWKYAPGDGFYSFSMSSAFRLPNGNSLAQEAYPQGDVMDSTNPSILTEVTADKQIVWKYNLKLRSAMEEGLMGGKQSYNVAKIMYYPGNYVGIANLFARIKGANVHRDNGHESIYLSKPTIRLSSNRVIFFNSAGCDIGLYSPSGRKVFSFSQQTKAYSLDAKMLPSGLYCAKVMSKNRVIASRMVTVVAP